MKKQGGRERSPMLSTGGSAWFEGVYIHTPERICKSHTGQPAISLAIGQATVLCQPEAIEHIWTESQRQQLALHPLDALLQLAVRDGRPHPLRREALILEGAHVTVGEFHPGGTLTTRSLVSFCLSGCSVLSSSLYISCLLLLSWWEKTKLIRAIFLYHKEKKE